jgi:hypothetical protein
MTEKCDICGKFFSLADIESGKAVRNFTPDMELCAEDSWFECMECNLSAMSDDEIKYSYNDMRQRFLEWRNIYDEKDVCNECGGSGIKSYSSTSMFGSGCGGQIVTSGVCDKCWGSGNKNEPWLNLKKLT